MWSFRSSFYSWKHKCSPPVFIPQHIHANCSGALRNSSTLPDWDVQVTSWKSAWIYILHCCIFWSSSSSIWIRSGPALLCCCGLRLTDTLSSCFSLSVSPSLSNWFCSMFLSVSVQTHFRDCRVFFFFFLPWSLIKLSFAVWKIFSFLFFP